MAGFVRARSGAASSSMVGVTSPCHSLSLFDQPTRAKEISAVLIGIDLVQS